MPSAGDIIRASDVAVQACRVTRAGVQSIPNSVQTAVAFDEERSDTDGMHSTVTNNSRITINTAGFYIVGFNGTMASTSLYTRVFAALRINGTTEIARGPNVDTTAAAQEPHFAVTTMREFSVGDYIEVLVFQTSTAARDLNAVDERSPEFWAARIGS